MSVSFDLNSLGKDGAYSLSVVPQEHPEDRVARLQHANAEAAHRRRMEGNVHVLSILVVVVVLLASVATALGLIPSSEKAQERAYNLLWAVGSGAAAVRLLPKKRGD